MGQFHRIGDLDISQDLAFQRKSWKAERIAWGFIGLTVIFGLAGLFGNGLLSHVTVGRADGSFQAEFDRFIRYDSPTMLRIHARVPGQQSIRVWFSREYASAIQIQQIIPQAQTTESSGEGVAYTFRTTNAGEPVIITFYLTVLEIGLVSGQVGISTEDAVWLSQFTYP